MKQNERDNRLKEAAENEANEYSIKFKSTVFKQVLNKWLIHFKAGFIKGCQSQAAKDYHNNQQSEVDIDELRKEFFSKCTNQHERNKYENPFNGPKFQVDRDPNYVWDLFLPYLRSKSEWIDASIEPALVDDEDYKEFIVIIDNEVRTGVVYCKKLKIFQGFMDTSKNPYKLNVSLYQPLPPNPTT